MDGDGIMPSMAQITQFIQYYWRIANGYVDSLPTWLRLTIHIIFYTACFSVFASHVAAFVAALPKWKAIPDSKLTYGYFSGTGTEQCSAIYVDVFNKSWDKKWFVASIAGLAYRLGQVRLQSKFLLFLLSLVHIPLAALGFLEMVFRALIGSIYALVFGLVHWLILVVAYFINLLLMPVWKMVDARKTVEQHCPSCYSTFRLPAYKCPGCGTVHKDLKPGKAGLFVARCQCGRFLPCAILSGRSRLETLCPECGRGLVASNAKEHTIILLGGNTSGKTAFLASFYKTYTLVAEKTSRVEINLEPKEDFAELEQMFFNGRTVPSSSTSISAYNFIHEFPSREETVVVYDVPDEVLLEEEYFEKNPLNFAYADGFVLLFDPFSERSVRMESKKMGEDVASDFYSADTLEEIVVAFVQQFSKIASRSSNKISDIPVAVVINKADMTVVRSRVGDGTIRKVFMADPDKFHNDRDVARNNVCRSYLVKLGLSNAINNLESVFSNVQYFAASSTGHAIPGKAFMPEHVLDPFAWLADQGGVGQSSGLLKRVCDTVNGTSSGGTTGLEKKYKEGTQLLASHDYDAAERTFRSLEDYKDSSEIVDSIPELRYQHAKQLLGQNKYEDAIREFLALKDYKDSYNCAVDGLYDMSEAYFSQGKYTQALAGYKKLGTYKGADKKLLETRYLLAKQKVMSGDAVSALDDFKAVGDYKDAADQIRAMAPQLIKAGVERNISFGPTEWRVLQVDSERGFALLITEGVTFLAPYHTVQAPVTWAESALHKYLNGKFLGYFSETEKNLIFPVKIRTPDNSQYGTLGGEDTFDFVFLLTADEAKRYFADKLDRVPAGKTSGYWYWLRTPGGTSQHAAIVEPTGAVSEGGNQVTNKEGGVRPALWITL